MSLSIRMRVFPSFAKAGTTCARVDRKNVYYMTAYNIGNNVHKSTLSIRYHRNMSRNRKANASVRRTQSYETTAVQEENGSPTRTIVQSIPKKKTGTTQIDKMSVSLPSLQSRVLQTATKLLFAYYRDCILQKNQVAFANTLRTEIETLGPLCIKLGQIMSCRKDIIPGYIIDVLEKLQDNVPPFSETKEVIENMIECEMRIVGVRDELYDIFESIDEKPIAAASIAQVHRARLKNGIEVAIKLQRPNLYQELYRYIELIRLLERQPFKVRFFQDLLILLKESVQNIKHELNFLEESENMLLMQQVFSAYDNILIPRVYQRFCSKKMIVMEYVGGKSIKTIQNPELANQLMSAFINGTLKYNMFHSDPHPGNISITDDNKLVIYDFGLISRLDENVNRTENKLALFAAYNSDVDAVIRYVIKSKIIHLKRGDVQSIEELTNGEYIILYKIISYFLDYIQEIDINNIGSKIISDDVLKSTAQNSPFYLDSVALLLIRTFSTLEGTCKTMHPEFNYNEVLKPLLPTFSSDLNFFVQQVEKNIMQLGDVQSNMRKTMSNQRMHDARILKISEEVDAVKSNTIACTIIIAILIGIIELI